MSYRRKQFTGAAVPTTTAGAINDTDTAISLTGAAGWPDGATPFVATLERDTVNEEKVLVTRAATVLTVIARGYDDTTAVSHNSGVAIEHTLDAGTVDQANRYVNLQTAKGDIVGHNGTNPTKISPAAGNGRVLTTNDAAATGIEFAYPADITRNASAPNAATSPYRAWYDLVLNVFRSSDGSAWELPAQLLVFGNQALRAAAVPAPIAGQLCLLPGIVEVYTGSAWRVVGIAEFANVTARNTYFTAIGIYNGARAYTLDDNSLWEYRNAEWIRLNHKVTVADTQPSGPQTGDIWLQPID
jgi:hypothetical protein